MRTTNGVTMVIDTGLPTGVFTDVITSHGEYIDLVKFGWGTALVTKDLDRKARILTEAGIGFYFGGTLFEHHVWTGQLDEYLRLVEKTGATHIEVSNGTIPLDQRSKAEYVQQLSQYRPVLSEVGYKDADRSALLTPADWVDALREDLDAGAIMVITEARESGRSGIAQADGSLRGDVFDAVVDSIDIDKVLFEAPTKDLQVELINSLGPTVNLGNIAPADIIGLETLRRGLRGDTLRYHHARHARRFPRCRAHPRPRRGRPVLRVRAGRQAGPPVRRPGHLRLLRRPAGLSPRTGRHRRRADPVPPALRGDLRPGRGLRPADEGDRAPQAARPVRTGAAVRGHRRGAPHDLPGRPVQQHPGVQAVRRPAPAVLTAR
jgi:phosphosulfolactate synthase